MTNVKELIAEIESGLWDESLSGLNKAIADRLTVSRRSRTAADFNIGDKIRLNELCGTQYIRGETGYVVSKRRTKVVIKLDRPVGRFVRVAADGTAESSDITVPVALLDKI
jgi:hypothetical protein